MKNNFLKHFFIIGSGTLISAAIGFISTPVITRIVDPDIYGQYSMFLLYSNIAMMVLYLGLDQSMLRFFYDNESAGYRKSLVSKCVKIPFLLSVAVAILVVTLNFANIIRFEFSKYIVVLLCIFTIVQVVLRFSVVLVRLQFKSRTFSLLNIIQRALFIVIALPLILFQIAEQLHALIYAVLFASIITMIMSVAFEKNIWFKSDKKDSDLVPSTFMLLKYAYPFIFSMAITSIFQAMGNLALNWFHSYKEVGIYSSAMTLVGVFSIVQNAFNAMWAPSAMEHYTADSEDRNFYQRGNAVITVVMFSIGITLIFGKDLLAILLGAEYREAAYILPFLTFFPMMYTISETTVNGLVFMKKSNMHIVVAAISCFANVCGNLILVPWLGSQGAAISTGLSYIVFFSCRTFLANKYFYTDFRLKKFYILVVIVSAYALYNSFVSFNLGSIIGYLVCLVALIILYKDTLIWITEYFRKLFFKKTKE